MNENGSQKTASLRRRYVKTLQVLYRTAALATTPNTRFNYLITFLLSISSRTRIILTLYDQGPIISGLIHIPDGFFLTEEESKVGEEKKTVKLPNLLDQYMVSTTVS